MLVFGAVQFQSESDGGLRITIEGRNDFLNSDDVNELIGWLNSRPITRSYAPRHQQAYGLAAQNAVQAEPNF